MADTPEPEPWPFDWSPPARGYEGPSLAQLTHSLSQLGGRYADLARVVEVGIFSVVALLDGLEKMEVVCDDLECVSSGRAVLCDIHGEEYDRAHR